MIAKLLELPLIFCFVILLWELVRQLTAIAKEELEHFESVNQWLERLDIHH